MASEDVGPTPEPSIEAQQENPASRTCSICLGEIRSVATTNRCRHEFCFSCILQWGKRKRECPLCRTRFQYLDIEELPKEFGERHTQIPPSLKTIGVVRDGDQWIIIVIGANAYPWDRDGPGYMMNDGIAPVRAEILQKIEGNPSKINWIVLYLDKNWMVVFLDKEPEAAYLQHLTMKIQEKFHIFDPALRNRLGNILGLNTGKIIADLANFMELQFD